jgi:hypothetical protein
MEGPADTKGLDKGSDPLKARRTGPEEPTVKPDGASGSFAIFATATRGYMIYLYVGDERAERRLHATYDGHWLWTALKTVALPEDALDPSESP